MTVYIQMHYEPFTLAYGVSKRELSKKMKMEVRILSSRKQRLQTKKKLEEEREEREERLKSSYNV